MKNDEESNILISNSINYFKILEIIWIKRSTIAKIVGCITLIAGVYTYLISNNYKATAVLLPESDATKSGGLGGLADLASVTGISIGGSRSLIELYPTIIKSEAVLSHVIYYKFNSKLFKNPVNIIEYLELYNEDTLKNYESAQEYLTAALDVNIDKKTKILTISLVLSEPQLAADIINKVLVELERFIKTKRISNASERRRWIETRMKDVRSDLERSENVLKEFMERNRQIAGSPLLQLEQRRLMREVEISSTMFVELKKQFELAKIDEINSIPIINILDTARRTTIKESPNRRSIVFLFFIASLALCIGYYVMIFLFNTQIKIIKMNLLKIYHGKEF